MQIRKTSEDDVQAAMRIFGQAQLSLRTRGVDQWQDGYPTEADLRRDMDAGCSYVLTGEDGTVLATASLWFEPEEDYREIEGAWKTNGAYGVFHRIAVEEQAKGQNHAGALVSYFEILCRERGVKGLRADTHAYNTSMRRMLEKNGFEYCGVIRLSKALKEHDAERAAYEKRL